MMTEQVLYLTHITKTYGDRLILDDVSALINRAERIGLVGENGTGKTTLAQIIMGHLPADSGKRQFLPGLEIGYLPQEADFDRETTVAQFLEQAVGLLAILRDTLTALETAMSAPGVSAEQLDALLTQYGAAQEDFAAQGGYAVDYRVDQVLEGLGLGTLSRAQQLHTLSGGEKTRVLLASLLLRAPGLLILDEPTNHLDVMALDWLERYLTDYAGAVLVISHDRRFLNKVVTQIIELSPEDHHLTHYAGNYDYYLAEREAQRVRQSEAYEEQQVAIKELQQAIKAATYSTSKKSRVSDNDKFLKNARRAWSETRQSRDIGAAKQQLKQLLDDPLARPIQRWQINPDFAPDEFASRDAIRLSDVSKAVNGRLLFAGVNVTLGSRDRAVLQGPNGIGKTTLLKLILGLETPDTGTIKIATSAQVGYLDQELETLDPDKTVFEEYSRGLIGSEDEHRANLHKYGLFTHEQVAQRVGSLSAGQRRKLQIARLIASRANVLLLDEPTNHLDLVSVEQFERALCDFPGAVLAVSHDRAFIERVATVRWSLHNAIFSAAE